MVEKWKNKQKTRSIAIQEGKKYKKKNTFVTQKLKLINKI